MMRKLLISLLILSTLALAPSWASAQSIYKQQTSVDLAINYEAARAAIVPGTAFWLHGGDAQVGITRWGGLGLAADFGGGHNAKISSSGVALDLVTITGGPQYRKTVESGADYYNVTIFGHFLAGEAHASNGVFAGSTAASTSATSFALKAGGGIDLDISPRLSLRIVQADWLRTQFPNGANDVQNHIQLGAGVVIHLR
jgi:hypothetical protein